MSRMSESQAHAAAHRMVGGKRREIVTLPPEINDSPLPLITEADIRGDERRQVAIWCQMIVDRATGKQEALDEIGYQLLGALRPMDLTAEGAD